MTFRLRHEWSEGVTILGMSLATCAHCGSLRSRVGSVTSFIRRTTVEADRVSETEPPCIEPRRDETKKVHPRDVYETEMKEALARLPEVE